MRPAPRSSARLRLFCLPYAGGGTVSYRSWAQNLSPDIELCLVQLPGREARMRETPYTDLGALVSDLTEELDPLLDLPYALFGHSMGAVIAFALTGHLRTVGLPMPRQLFVSGRRAPQIPDRDAPLHTLPDAAFVAALVHRYNAIPQVLLQDADLLRLFLPTLRADFTMIETYPYVDAPPLDCAITAFGGWEDGRATQADLSAWRDQTRGDFTLRMFPGGHFFIQTCQEALVAAIGESLVRHTDPVAPSVSAHRLGVRSAGAVANTRGID
ncbi:MAG TPA: alpha/beta fold hydrolase [Thermomicrobiales bacterium]|nr:alpha/beta fold hydrolase [Thermomicrobiales bacterium]